MFLFLMIILILYTTPLIFFQKNESIKETKIIEKAEEQLACVEIYKSYSLQSAI